jgi:hypothetical protein
VPIILVHALGLVTGTVTPTVALRLRGTWLARGPRRLARA